jgi:hypothetical protein
MIGCGIATTSALIVRVHCCITGAAVVAAVVSGGVSGFTDSVSALGDSVAGLAVVGETGVASLVAGAGFGSDALSSATGFSAAGAAFVRRHSPQ